MILQGRCRVGLLSRAPLRGFLLPEAKDAF